MIHIEAKIGQNVKFWFPELSNIGRCEIGDDCVIHSHTWIGDGAIVGKGVHIEAYAFIPNYVSLEDNVFVGPHVCFTNDKRPPSKGREWYRTTVANGASIGAGAIILPGLHIGENAVIGAGAVLTKNVGKGETWVGNPAHLLIAGWPHDDK